MASPTAQTTSVKLTATASLLHNNLAASPGGWLAGLHNSINSGAGKILLQSLGQSRDGAEISQGTSIRYVQLANAPVLCVSSSNGTQIYTEDGSTLLHFVRVDDQGGKADTLKCHRGACVVHPLQHIVIGTSKGGLAAVDASAPGSFSALPEFEASGSPKEVADVCFNSLANSVFTAHDDGEIRVWALEPQPYTNTAILPAHAEAPVRIASLGMHIVIAYATGQILLLDALAHTPAVEITAHARCLTAVDVREEEGQIATVGEDTVLNLWHVEPQNGQVSLLYTAHVTAKLLTGVMLTAAGAAVTAYDSDELLHVSFS
eukprot:TRINITY_DN94911_c0_g1_i1.p2 TRINITY_DN94911_c0_g1~~TRINITY_DN94911_c0_g1_i1.p2  ORF type:complete len:318 (+),score=58.26 TRINITY_DN94911_c0_g1_i1:107-1060(+)